MGNKVEVKKKGIFLNGEKLQDVFDYELKSSANNTTELTLKLYVSQSKVFVNGGTDDTDSDLGKGVTQDTGSLVRTESISVRGDVF